MNYNDFEPEAPGELIQIAGIHGADYAFVPAPLPPSWTWPARLWPLLLDARVQLAGLNGIGKHLPNADLLLRPLQYREAMRSNSLEGTFTQPQQQALFELDPTTFGDEPLDDYREVSNYARALRYYFEGSNPLPLSLRLIRNLHAMLLDSVRGAEKEPGAFRRLQVHIGQPPRYVPPPSNHLGACLDALEKYLHFASLPYDPLVDAFLVHYQFEAIHPFRDGNGRVGRLLLSIMITDRCGLSAPWLHMSAYFDDHRQEYIDRLLRVSTHADWDGWIEFCLRGVIAQAADTESRCEQLLVLNQDYKQRLAAIGGSLRLSAIVDRLFAVPVIRTAGLGSQFNITYPTAKADIEKLVRAGIVTEIAGSRTKTYVCSDILDIIYG